jgi:DNA-binding NtrC family response regulator
MALNAGNIHAGKGLAMRGKVLLISGDESERRFLSDTLGSAGFSIVSSGSAEGGMEILRRDQSIDAALVDLFIGESGGLKLLEEIRKESAVVQVIIMSGSGSDEDAGAALRLGAFEYLRKPLERERTLLLTTLAARMAHLARENAHLKSRIREKVTLASIAGGDRELMEAKEKAGLLAPLDSPALIFGEPGVGRGMFAEAIHNEGPRAQSPFVFAKITVGRDEREMERLLVGQEAADPSAGGEGPARGLMEKAENGTLYLCDIAKLGARPQAAVLGALQRGEFFRIGGYHPVRAGFRLIAGSAANLEEEVKAGRFREDLYFRINITPLSIPPLRRRKDGVVTLTRIFLNKFVQKHGKEACSISPAAMAALAKYRWPGNVRELSETIEAMVAQKSGGDIGFGGLPDRIYKDARRPSRIPRQDVNVATYAAEKMEFERKYMLRALEECEGNITVMARITGLSRPALYEKLRKHGLK